MPPRRLTAIDEPAPIPDSLVESSPLQDLSSWREQLARSIARNNIGLRSEAIATAANRTVGWLVMLCVAEDRGLIAKGTLQGISEADDSYLRLAELFRYTIDPWDDEKSHDIRRDTAMETVVIEDAVIKKILSRCCSPNRPYDFATVPTEVIAQVYGRHLARTIRRSAAHQAVVVDTPDTIQSGGTVVPTSAMIKYMAQSTVQQARANRSHEEILPFRVVDPACSAGLALLFAYQDLIDQPGGSRFTFAEREEILRQSIHGVDINRHAVAITKMLLFFKLCEGESARTLHEDFFTLAGQVFRELVHTIRCGNALVGQEISHDESWAFCPARERHTLNLFAWNSSFPEIYTAGGFDAVIGSLPAGPLVAHEWIQQYFQRHYEVYHQTAERSAYFIEKGLALLRTGGSIGFVISDRWFRAKSGTALRHLVASYQIEEIVNFSGAGGNRESPAPCLVRIVKHAPSHVACITQVESTFTGNLPDYIRSHRFPIDQATLSDGGWTLRDTRSQKLVKKIRKRETPLREFILEEPYRGMAITDDDVFVISDAISKQLIKADPKSKSFIRPFISGPTIGRYAIRAEPRFVIFIPKGWTARHKAAVSHPWRWLKKRHPALAMYLKQSAEGPKARSNQGDYWWETSCDQDFWKKKQSRIFFRDPFTCPAFVFDSGQAIADDSSNAIASASLYLLGVLNSRLISFILTRSVQQDPAMQQNFGWDELKDLPIYTPDFDNPADAARHKQMEALVAKMLELHEYLPRAKNDLEKRLVQQEIDALDVRIDALVYELYGLTAEEVAVVEESVGNNYPFL